MKKYLAFSFLASTLLAGNAYSVDCKPMDAAIKCSDLGFKKRADDCKGMNTLHCPFDLNMLWCGAKQGTPESSDPSECSYSIVDTSKADKTGSSCVRNGITYYEKNCSGITKSKCTTGKFVTTCTAVNGTLYGTCDTSSATSCDWNVYTWDRCQVINGRCDYCGNKAKFKCCNDGYAYYNPSTYTCSNDGSVGFRAIKCSVADIVIDPDIITK